MTAILGAATAITGAASGIGRALAIELAARGSDLALADRDEAGLQAVAAEIASKHRVKVTVHRVDVGEPGQIAGFAQDAVAAHPALNILVNNAGVALLGKFSEIDQAQMDWLMNINFWGVVYGTKAFLPHLKASGEGHIVNVSSAFGLISFPSQSAYNAAKFAVRGFTDSLRMELEIEKAPVSVTTVHPGGIKTNIVRNARIDPASVSEIGGDVEKARRDAERPFITSPQKAARQILAAVQRDRRRALIGPDAKVIDFVSRLPAGFYQRMLTKAAARARR